MKLSKEDIKKFGTEDEQMLLEARPTNAFFRQRFLMHLEEEIRRINKTYENQQWEDLKDALDDAHASAQMLIKYSPKS